MGFRNEKWRVYDSIKWNKNSEISAKYKLKLTQKCSKKGFYYPRIQAFFTRFLWNFDMLQNLFWPLTPKEAWKICKPTVHLGQTLEAWEYLLGVPSFDVFFCERLKATILFQKYFDRKSFIFEILHSLMNFCFQF